MTRKLVLVLLKVITFNHIKSREQRTFDSLVTTVPHNLSFERVTCLLNMQISWIVTSQLDLY